MRRGRSTGGGEAPEPEEPGTAGLAETAGFEVLPPDLAEEVEAALAAAVEAGVVFEAGPTPLRIFQAAVAESIRDVEAHPRGRLLGRFLRQGPYEDGGPIPEELAGERLSDEETARAIRFVHSFMVNTFKGLLAELLAARPVARLARDLQATGRLPPETTVFAGDVVRARTVSGETWRKGADFHLLEPDRERPRLRGVAEVKSFPMPRRGLERQLDRHLERAARGLSLRSPGGSASREVIPAVDAARVLRIAVATERWTLPRDFRLDDDGLHLPEVEVPVPEDRVEETAPGRWRVVLRWSQEALAEAALGLTFWYMGKVGELHYRERPADWQEMTPAEAGRNAAKMMLYYALLRAPEGSLFERQATALYNAYGFGYSLGMNFVGPGRRRRMLWFEDLREIQETGRTRDGGRVRGFRVPRT